MLYQYYAPLPPPRQCWRRGGDLNYAKFKCITKPQPSPHLKDEDLQGDLLVNVYISVHAYSEQSISPCIEHVLVSNQGQMTHLSPSIAQ